MTQVVLGCTSPSKIGASQADKGKGLVSQASGDDRGPISMEVYPPLRKATWKRRACASNDFQQVKMEDSGSLKRAATIEE
ncbi:hypothetical protein ACOSP7_016590 [Xanthoceras sorbifolium]